MTAPARAGHDHWLFDLDGTLVDSGPAHERAFRRTLRESLPAALPRFRYAEHAGRPTAAVFADLGGTDPALTARKQALYRELVDAGEVGALPGAGELLAELRRRDCRRYVVTGASRRSAELVLRAAGLAGYVEGLVTAEDVVRGKPDPAAYLEACRRWVGAGGTAVAVEDSPAGVLAARAAGLPVLQVGTPELPGLPDLLALMSTSDAA